MAAPYTNESALIAITSRDSNGGVAPAGFEPAISALRGLRPRPLDDGATIQLLVGGIGFEPMTSCV
jgi:hypothetical protein